MTRPNSHPETTFKTFTIAVAQTDDETTVTVFSEEAYMGSVPIVHGRARRRKGDRRNPQLGIALATGRAFQELANREMKFADEVLSPPKDASAGAPLDADIKDLLKMLSSED